MHNIYTMIKPDNTQWIFSFLLDFFVPAELQTDSEVKQIISMEWSDEVEIMRAEVLIKFEVKEF